MNGFSINGLYSIGILFTTLSAPVHGGASLIDVELIVDGLTAPLDLTFAPDGSGRRFIVDQTGLVFVLMPDDTVLSLPFLDIQDRVIVQSAFDERGLLAIAFHPEFATNGKLYATYSAQREGGNLCVDNTGNVPKDPSGCPFQYMRRVSEFTVSAEDLNSVDPDTERVLFKVPWPGRKHNGGGLAFGPDGLLYIGLGDGGWVHGPDGGEDQFEVPENLLFGDLIAQDLTMPYGKILRIDVDRDDFPEDEEMNYGIPPDNPLVGFQKFPDEIFAWGFRNPFRITFDREGDRSMYVSATAETFFEAIYRVNAPGNFGWGAKEGSHCIVRASARTPPETISCTDDIDCPVGPQLSFCVQGRCTCSDVGPLGLPIQDPVVEYLNFSVEDPESQFGGQGFGRATVGGRVYRGNDLPWLRGRLVAGDFAINTFDGQILIAKPRTGKRWKLERAFVFDGDDPAQAGFVKSIGVDAEGELYAITGNFTATGLQGRIWKIVPDLAKRAIGRMGKR